MWFIDYITIGSGVHASSKSINETRLKYSKYFKAQPVNSLKYRFSMDQSTNHSKFYSHGDFFKVGNKFEIQYVEYKTEREIIK